MGDELDPGDPIGPCDSCAGTTPEPHEAACPAPPAEGLRVLVVDDQGDLRAAIGKYLTHFGYHVTEAGDGHSALDLIDLGPAFHVLLTDLSLPDIDGRELARQARLRSPTTWNALVTGWELEDDELESGDLDYIFLKPVDMGSLRRTLDAALGLDRPEPAP